MKTLFASFALLLLTLPFASAQNSTSGTITASASSCAVNADNYAGPCVTLPLPAFSSTATISVLGTYTATLQFEVTANSGASWVSATAIPQPIAAGVTSTTSTGTWQVNVAGMSHIRIRGSAYTSGTASITLAASSGIGVSPSASGTSSSTVQGPGASGSAVVGNPNLIAGVDSAGVARTVGVAATATAPGIQVGSPITGADGSSNTLLFPNSANGGAFGVAPFVFNGATWDRTGYGPTTTTSAAVTTATTTLLHTGVASKKFRIYNLLISQNGANGGTVQLVEGTGATCGTGTANLGPVIPLGANTLSNDIVAINFGNSPLTVATAADSVCFTTTVGAASSIVVSDQTANY